MTDLDARPIRADAFLGALNSSAEQWTDPDALQVLERFQQVMEHFLGVQREVMLGYLSATGSVPTEASPTLAATEASPQLPIPPGPTRPSPPSAPTRTTPPPAPAPESQARARPEPAPAPDGAFTPSTSADVPDVVATLLEIVEARTGYPRDLLDLNLRMEADLGMDSIKRVEIIGTLCRTFTPDRPTDPELIEALIREGTLNGLAQRFEGSLARSNTGSADRGDTDREAD